MAPDRPANRLIDEASPYLLQHAHNPVDWYPWGDEAFDRARAENKPVLLSVGYSACHWCHVMEHESFENEAIAEIMNRHFVCVKVDREERPDIDAVYMSAVQLLAGQGGWPMTAFLTPEGKPFYGGTYFPPEDRWGRPGFPRVLEAVAAAWRERREEVMEQADAVARQIAEASRIELPPAPVTADVLDRAYEALRPSFDPRYGGFGDAPKFPQPMVLEFLLRYARRTGRREPLQMATFTLERMAMGGIFDHLGGGFHRYSTDAMWLVPHFEKMLYDNAQIASALVHAWRATGDDLFREAAERTLDYLRREMMAEDGAFYAAQDADSEGEEGRYFVWTADEVEGHLGPEDAALFARCYDVRPHGNWEGRNVLNLPAPLDAVARSEGMAPETLAARLSDLRAKLLAARERRERPLRDSKVLTSWNGLAISAFAEAGVAFLRPDYLQAAANAARFALTQLVAPPTAHVTDGFEGRALMHCATQVAEEDEHAPQGVGSRWRARPIPAFLDDHACLADGLLRLFEATGDRLWLNTARWLADEMLRRFRDPGGGFYSTAHDAEALIQRPRDAFDNAVPSGQSVAVDVLLQISALTGDLAYAEAAAPVLRSLAEAMARHPMAFGRILCAADRFVGPLTTVAVAGPTADPRTEALLRAARSGWRPNVLVAPIAEDAHDGSPWSEASAPRRPDAPHALVCRDTVCGLPVTSPEELVRQLDT